MNPSPGATAAAEKWRVARLGKKGILREQWRIVVVCSISRLVRAQLRELWRVVVLSKKPFAADTLELRGHYQEVS